MAEVQEEAVEKAQKLVSEQVLDMFGNENDHKEIEESISDTESKDSMVEELYSKKNDEPDFLMILVALIGVMLGGALIGYTTGMNFAETVYYTTITMTTGKLLMKIR